LIIEEFKNVRYKNSVVKKEEILRQQPFRSVVRIINAESLESASAISGETFRVTGSDGIVYKLHYADSLFNAREIERNVNALPHLFPKFYGREERYLLFDWIDGRTLTKEDDDPQIYEKLGEFCADVHNANLTKSHNVNKFFFSRLEMIPETVLAKEDKVKIT